MENFRKQRDEKERPRNYQSEKVNMFFSSHNQRDSSYEHRHRDERDNKRQRLAKFTTNIQEQPMREI